MGTVEPNMAFRYTLFAVRVLGSFADRLAFLDHFAKLTTTLDQGSDSTKVTWTLEGVPLGMEEEINRNLNGY